MSFVREVRMTEKHNQFSLHSRHLNYCGAYFIVSNGFMKKVCGELRIAFDDLLMVEVVGRRSKKTMYIGLSIGALLIVVLDSMASMLTSFPILIASILCVVGAIYFFSLRQYVEFTTMHGTYRVTLDKSNVEMRCVVEQMQHIIP